MSRPVAEVLELSYQQVQRYENGRNKISVERIQEIASGLAAPVAYFFETYFIQPILLKTKKSSSIIFSR
jgi:transcriptional regulator with XRE-family HTH domain